MTGDTSHVQHREIFLIFSRGRLMRRTIARYLICALIQTLRLTSIQVLLSFSNKTWSDYYQIFLTGEEKVSNIDSLVWRGYYYRQWTQNHWKFGWKMHSGLFNIKLTDSGLNWNDPVKMKQNITATFILGTSRTKYFLNKKWQKYF